MYFFIGATKKGKGKFGSLYMQNIDPVAPPLPAVKRFNYVIPI